MYSNSTYRNLLIVLWLVFTTSCFDSGGEIIIETFPQPIEAVTTVKLSIIENSPPQLHITAQGNAASTGWTNPLLSQVAYDIPPQDGIYDFYFMAVPPDNASGPALTPIEVQHVLNPLPDDLLGVRIHAIQNNLVALLIDATTPVAYFEFRGPDDTDRFVIKLIEESKIQHARDLLSGTTTELPAISGTIVIEQAPYNPNWSYHLNPTSIGFFDFAIEVCDANMRYVEDHLNEVGGAFLPNNQWCPWGSQLTQEVGG